MRRARTWSCGLGLSLATAIAACTGHLQDDLHDTSSSPIEGAMCRNHGDCDPDQRCRRGRCEGRGGSPDGSTPDASRPDAMRDAGPDTCTPICDGRACGDDGCGGSCGTCAGGELCDASGMCAPLGEVRAFPGAEGFGTDSPCGRGGRVFAVRSQADFDECLATAGPRVCVFETSGTFSARSVREPFLTIAGQTAPSPGIQISPQLDVRTHDVCVFHVRIRGDGRVGDVVHLNHRQSGGAEQTHHLVFDHISVSWSTDENFSSYAGPGNAVGGAPGTPDGYVTDVTLSNSISSEGLSPHSMGFLAARPGHDRFSVLGNIFASNGGRNPKLGSGQFTVVNNLTYNHVGGAISLGSSGGVFEGYIASNVVLPGPSTSPGGRRAAVSGMTGNSGINALFVRDNMLDGSVAADPWSSVEWGGTNLTQLGAPPAWVGALRLTELPSSEVMAHNLACAGARPLDRDAVDARIIADISAGTGAIIGTAPALPDLSGGSHTLPSILTSTDPADWTRDSNGDGYTDVEDELYRMAQALECGR